MSERQQLVFALMQRDAAPWLQVGRELLYVVGVTAFIFGERAVVTGKAPALVFGPALPIAALIVVAAVMLLVPVRLATKPDVTKQQIIAEIAD